MLAIFMLERIDLGQDRVDNSEKKSLDYSKDKRLEKERKERAKRNFYLEVRKEINREKDYEDCMEGVF